MRGEPTRILLLEDERALRSTFILFARHYGIQVDAVDTTEGARALLNAEGSDAFDLIVCDFNLAGGRTSEALVRGLLHEAAPVIVVTGNLAQALPALGPDACVLPKPIRFRELVTRAEAARARSSRGQPRVAAG